MAVPKSFENFFTILNSAAWLCTSTQDTLEYKKRCNYRACYGNSLIPLLWYVIIHNFTTDYEVYMITEGLSGQHFFYHSSHNFKKVINNSSRATGCDRSGDIWGELFSLFVHCLSSNIRIISWGKQTTLYCYNIPVDMLMIFDIFLLAGPNIMYLL